MLQHIRSGIWTATLLAAALAAPAWGQDFIDEDEEPTGRASSAPSPTVPGMVKDDTNLKADEASGGKGTFAPTVPGDRVFTVGDRVKAVQKKLILKKGRFEVAPAFSMSVNDPFFQKMGGGVAAAYWPSDNLGVFADIYSMATIETENVRLAKQATRSTLLDSRLRFLAMAGFQWSPFYGKVAWFGRDIVHFDLFLSAGFGVVRTSTSTLEDTPPVQVASTFGIGQRYLVNRFMALFFKVEDRIYPEVYDLKAGRVASISNVLTLSLGASFFFPMDFEYSP